MRASPTSLISWDGPMVVGGRQMPRPERQYDLYGREVPSGGWTKCPSPGCGYAVWVGRDRDRAHWLSMGRAEGNVDVSRHLVFHAYGAGHRPEQIPAEAPKLLFLNGIPQFPHCVHWWGCPTLPPGRQSPFPWKQATLPDGNWVRVCEICGHQYAWESEEGYAAHIKEQRPMLSTVHG